MKKIRIHGAVNTADVVKIIDSNSSTWTELKDELVSNGMMNSNMYAVIRENQVVMNLGGYELPSGIGQGKGRVSTNAYDFTLMLTTDKIDGGGTVNINDIESSIKQARKDFHEDLNDCSIHEIHDKVDEILDNLIDDLNSDGLDIEQFNTYEDSVSTERTVTAVRNTNCEDCDELDEFKASITR